MNYLVVAQDRHWGDNSRDTLVSVQPPLDEAAAEKAVELLNTQDRIGMATMFASVVDMESAEPCTGIRVNQFIEPGSEIKDNSAIAITSIISAAILQSGEQEVNQRILSPASLSDRLYE